MFFILFLLLLLFFILFLEICCLVLIIGLVAVILVIIYYRRRMKVLKQDLGNRKEYFNKFYPHKEFLGFGLCFLLHRDLDLGK
jgi:amino acid permease